MLKVDYLQKEESFRSEIKSLFLVSQVLSFRHTKQTSQSLADTIFNLAISFACKNQSIKKFMDNLTSVCFLLENSPKRQKNILNIVSNITKMN